MAKSIKAIKCPQCGSTQKKEVGPEHFRCESCGTEYFLDNDDININYTERKTGPGAFPLRARQLAAIAFGALFLLFLLSKLFQSDPTPVYQAPSRPAVAEEKFDTTYQWSSTQEQLYLNTAREPVLFVLGTRRYKVTSSRGGTSYLPNDSSFAVFYNGRTGQKLKTVSLPDLDTKSSSNRRFKSFESGALYLIVNERKVYEVDKAAYTVKDVTQKLFQAYPELNSGVAKLVGIHYARNDGFELLTNDGRAMRLYPFINKVYTEKDYFKARGDFNTLRPNSTVGTGFEFSTESTNYPEEKLQLIRYQYRYNLGGPQEPARFSWSRDYGRAGIFNGTEPHTKSLVGAYNVQQMRLLSFKDFTPGRLYFSPDVLYYDDELVLIRFQPTAAENGNSVLQSLNAKTGAINFTTPLPDKFRAGQVVRTADGFVLQDDRTTTLLSPDGTLSRLVSIP